MSKLSGKAHTVLYRDESGWEYSVTAVSGMILPTRIFVSRLLIKLIRAASDMRDYQDNLMEVSSLSMRCGLDDVPTFDEIDDTVAVFIKNQRKDGDDTVEHFKEVLKGIFDGIEEASQDVIHVKTIPTAFSRTRPDRVTPQPFGFLASVPDACPA